MLVCQCGRKQSRGWMRGSSRLESGCDGGGAANSSVTNEIRDAGNYDRQHNAASGCNLHHPALCNAACALPLSSTGTAQRRMQVHPAPPSNQHCRECFAAVKHRHSRTPQLAAPCPTQHSALPRLLCRCPAPAQQNAACSCSLPPPALSIAASALPLSSTGKAERRMQL